MLHTIATDNILGDTQAEYTVWFTSDPEVVVASKSSRCTRDKLQDADDKAGNSQTIDSIWSASDSETTMFARYSRGEIPVVKIGDTETKYSVRVASDPEIARDSGATVMSTGLVCELEFAMTG